GLRRLADVGEVRFRRAAVGLGHLAEKIEKTFFYFLVGDPQPLVDAADRALPDRARLTVDRFAADPVHAFEGQRRDSRERGMVFRQLQKLLSVGVDEPEL